MGKSGDSTFNVSIKLISTILVNYIIITWTLGFLGPSLWSIHEDNSLQSNSLALLGTGSHKFSQRA